MEASRKIAFASTQLTRAAFKKHGRRLYATSAKLNTENLSELIEMPPCDFKPQPYQGPSYEEVLQIRKQNLNPALFSYYRKPILVHQGHMQWLFDHTGRRYLDMFAGIVTVSVGHCHPKVTEATAKQSQKLQHSTNIYLHPQIHQYAEQITSTLPGDLKVAYFTNSGSEANELAALMARLYTGCYEVVSLRNCYHGASPYLMGLTAINTWRYNVADGFGMQQSMNPDVFRGPWGGKNCRDCPVPGIRSCDCAEGHCKASDLYADQLEEVLQYSTSKNRVAAFFAESIQGVGGGVQLPKGYLKKVYESVRARGGLCVADEVQTGFGRTGEHMWGFQGHDVIPDIVTMAKGIANGFPMGAVITTPAIAATLGTALHFNTYGGNPVATATASAVLDVIEEEKIMDHCSTLGPYYLKELAKLRDEFEIVGDVRGKGLMISVEMVTDKETKTPLPADDMNDIWEMTKDMGLLIGKGGLHGTAFRIKPPMCVTKEDADFAVAVMRRSIQEYMKNKQA